MTVSNVPNTLSFPGPVTAPTPLAITYQFFDQDELDVRAVTAGVESLLVLGVDYTVTGGSGATGTVVPVNNILTGTTWTVLRVSGLTQDFDYSAQSTFPEQSHEDALDRITLGQQDLDAKVERAMRISPADDQTVDMTLPLKTLRAGLFLLFNAAGEPTAAALSDATTLPTTMWSEAWMLESTSASARANLEVIKDGENDWGEGTPITQIISTTNGARPSASAAGTGSLLFTTDQLRILLSNGTLWLDMLQERVARNALPGSSVVGGRLIATSDSQELFIDDGSSGPVHINIPYRGMMQGFKASWSSNILAGCGGGECSSELVGGLRHFLSHATGMEKDVAVTWAPGDGNGGWPDNTAVRPTGGWQHFFALGHTDGIQVDFGWDTDPVAGALLADAAVMSNGFDAAYRRIYSIKTVAATEDIMQIHQQGDWFYYDDPTALINDTLSFLSVSSSLLTVLNAPLGIESQILMSVAGSAAGSRSFGATSGAASEVDADSALPIVDGEIGFYQTQAADEVGGNMIVHTDTLQRIRGRASSAGDLDVLVLGWMDDRGRYA